MILVQLVEEYSGNICGKFETVISEMERKFNEIPDPASLEEYPRYLKMLTSLFSNVKCLRFTYDLKEIQKLLEEYYGRQITGYEERLLTVNKSYADKADKRIQEVKQEAEQENEQIRKQFDEDNRVYLELEEKRKKLEEHGAEIIDLCSKYGITTADVEISNSSFQVNELDELYDEYLAQMVWLKRRNVVSWLRDMLPNAFAQGAILIFLFLLGFTSLLDFLAVGFFMALAIAQYQARSKMKAFTVLLGLVYNVHPLEMGFQSEIDSEALKSGEVDEDSDTGLSAIANEWETALKELEEKNPEYELEREKIALANQADEIQTQLEAERKKFDSRREQLTNAITERVYEMRKQFEDEKARVRLLGQECQKSVVYSTKYKMGLKDGVIEETKDYGLMNFTIVPSQDRALQACFMQVLLANAICNVRAGYLTVTIYDPNELGQSLITFCGVDVAKYIRVEKENPDTLVAELREYVSKNMRDMKGQNILAFNKDAELNNKTPREYKLLIILSQSRKLEEDEAFLDFMSYSAKYGVLIWMATELRVKGTMQFTEPFAGVMSPYPISLSEFGVRVAKMWGEEIENVSTSSLPWEDFIKIACPEAQLWTCTTDKYIDLDPGFYEGDPTQHKGFTVGNDGNIHAICVGGTGAGKSVFLNHLIATMAQKYSPRELELWLVDYKGSEFQFYLESEEHPYMLPHIKTCLCTSDGDFGGSVFKALRKSAEERYEALKAAGFKNMYEYNKAMRRAGTPEKCWTRIIIVNDEFQVIFRKAEPNVVEQLNKDITFITTVARAAGIHLLFASQSMQGTISQDTLANFTLRFALRCDEEVSRAVLGTSQASDIKQKFGYLYIRSLELAPEQYKRYRTPYLSDQCLREHICKLAERAKQEGIPPHDVITYQESVKHSVDEINAAYKAYGDRFPEFGAFFLGMPMVYAQSKVPKNVVLGRKNNTHMISIFEDLEDFVNFYKTIMANMECFKRRPQIFVNSQIADLHYLCDVDQVMTDDFAQFSDEKCSPEELIDMFRGIYDLRVQSGNYDVPAYYVLLGWDKAMGFGIDPDPLLVNSFVNLMQLCGEYNMHFIFINTAKGAIRDNVINACMARIAGRCSENSSYAMLQSKIGTKSYDSRNGYMFLWLKNELIRLKVFQGGDLKEIPSDEIVI